jgi:hypothetical protein
MSRAAVITVLLVLSGGCVSESRLSLSDFTESGSGSEGGASPGLLAPKPAGASVPVPAVLVIGAGDAAATGAPGASPSLGQDLGQGLGQGLGTGERRVVRNGNGEPLLIEAKIGDINGRPVLAGAFLEDLMPRLRATAATAPSREAWRREAMSIVGDKLRLTIRDEVLYREARSKLSDEVRQGLFIWLARVRERVRQQYRGSETAADERLREDVGLGLEEYLSAIQRGQLIRQELESAQSDYPPVTWTDIRNEYARRYAEFNPPPMVYARMILCPDEAGAELVRQRLDSGEAFAEIAGDKALNRFRPEQGGMLNDQGQAAEGDMASARLIGIEALNTALTSLEPGAWAGPVSYREASRGGGAARQGFVLMERIEHSSRPLSDGMLQLSLRGEIEARREAEARTRYLGKLLASADLGPREQSAMTARLVQVAEVRLFDAQGR